MSSVCFVQFSVPKGTVLSQVLREVFKVLLGTLMLSRKYCRCERSMPISHQLITRCSPGP